MEGFEGEDKGKESEVQVIDVQTGGQAGRRAVRAKAGGLGKTNSLDLEELFLQAVSAVRADKRQLGIYVDRVVMMAKRRKEERGRLGRGLKGGKAFSSFHRSACTREADEPKRR